MENQAATSETNKRKHQDELAEESEPWTELTLSFSNTKKPRTCEISPSTGNPLVINAINLDFTLAKTTTKNVSTTIRLFGKTIIVQDGAVQDRTSFVPRSKKTSHPAETEGRSVGFNPEYERNNGDLWKIRKKLRDSDVGNLSRLLVPSNLVKDHILPFLTDVTVKEVDSNGARLVVWDFDTKTEHVLIFKRWPSTKGYVFIEKWTQEFVNRRNLKFGNEIGLFWDPHYSRINFALLNPTAAPASDGRNRMDRTKKTCQTKSKKIKDNRG